MTDHEKLDDGAKRWLDRPGSVDIIFWILCLVCGVLFLADAFYVKHPHFEVEYLFGFYALFGFVFSVGLVLSAKELRRFLKRGEDYYD
ncbi:MAG: hypothetical protein OSB46_00680 [Alphaproteobacteria bacterium]|jgi:hypothetical protein|nr:hypothetical protein [Alphaproteobacteria bacterium]